VPEQAYHEYPNGHITDEPPEEPPTEPPVALPPSAAPAPPQWMTRGLPYNYLYAFDELLRPFGNSMAVYYKNIETGFTFIHNENETFFSASVPKAFFSLYIYLKAERGEVDLDSYVTYTWNDYHGGSGIIRMQHTQGEQFTQRELLRLNLSYSDNIATNMLRRVHGIEGYRQFAASLGGNPNHVHGYIFNSLLTLNDAALFANEIFNYIEWGGTYSGEFKAHLLDNQYPFIVSDYPVASKTGWRAPFAWHDMAIVYAPSPYILIILSRRDGWSERDYQDFYVISSAFQEFNSTWFVPLVEGGTPMGLPERYEPEAEPEEPGDDEGYTEPEEADVKTGDILDIRVLAYILLACAAALFTGSFFNKRKDVFVIGATHFCCDYHSVVRNRELYLGKKIQMEGNFQTEQARNSEDVYMVSRDMTTPCDTNETFFFELDMGTAPIPEQDERIRVVGVLQEYERRGGKKNLRLSVTKITHLKRKDAKTE
jgi:beta-lactamase class A